MASRKRRSGHKRPSVSQAERLASLRWNIADAKEALVNAVSMGDWRGVKKYSSQLEKLETLLSRSSIKGSRRIERERRSMFLTARQSQASELQRRRGRTGVP